MKNSLLFCLMLVTLKLLVNGESEVTSQVTNRTLSIDVCTLQVQNGTCDKKIKRYRYYPLMRSCLSFIYSGCGGNLNNFESREDCMNNCPGIFVSFRQPLHCYEELDKGQCTEQKLRFYYNWRVGKCEKFVYSGCFGNNNRFASLDECIYQCKKYDFSIQIS